MFLDILLFVYFVCVDESGIVFKIVIKIIVSFVGEKCVDGIVFKGVVGGVKVLGVYFSFVWCFCVRLMVKMI